jgi:hypothetical protein
MPLTTPTDYRIFIGGSGEANDDAEALQACLASWCFPEIWNQGFFEPSSLTIESLEQGLHKFDLAIFLLTSTDIAIIRKRRYTVPRDNLLFELGLSYGLLGRSRTIIVLPDNSTLKLPTDLNGITYLKYRAGAPNPKAAFGPISTTIKTILEKHGKGRRILSDSAIIAKVAPKYHADAATILNKFKKLAFDSLVIKPYFNVELRYDVSDIANGFVTESMVFNYACVNISQCDVDYDVQITSIEDTSTNPLMELAKTDSNGKKRLFYRDDSGTHTSGFSFHKTSIVMEPGALYEFSLKYVFRHPTSPSAGFVHNTLSTRNPAMSARMVVIVPKGFTFSLLAAAEINPDVWNDRLEFTIPCPLLPHHSLEYIFRKE